MNGNSEKVKPASGLKYQQQQIIIGRSHEQLNWIIRNPHRTTATTTTNQQTAAKYEILFRDESVYLTHSHMNIYAARMVFWRPRWFTYK